MSSNNLLTLSGGVAVRQYRLTDASSLSKNANNKKVWDMLRNRLPHPYTEADSVFWIEHNQNPENHVRTGPWGQEDGPLVPANYAVTVDDVAIGSIGLDFYQDVYTRCAEVGYWIGEEYWGKGIMSKVAPAFVDWTWKTFGRLERLDCGHWATNPASGKVMAKAGFVYEGLRKKRVFKNGVFIDEVLYGAVRPE